MKELVLQILLSPAFQSLAVGLGAFFLAKKLSEPYRKTLYMLLTVIEQWDKECDIIPKVGKVFDEAKLERIKTAVARTLTAEQKKIVDNFLSERGWLGPEGDRKTGNWDKAPEADKDKP